MQTPTRSKVCLASATTLVLGAWLGGNPFLPGPGTLPVGGSEPVVSDGSAAMAADELADQELADQKLADQKLADQKLAAQEPCPDAALRDAVVEVVRGLRGEPIWALRDGRFVVRNQKREAGQPAVLFVSAPQFEAPASGKPVSGKPVSGKPAAGKLLQGATPAVWQRPPAVKPEGE
ncbi:MAG: hypothetical protein JNK49_07100 [Planctomycetes bacterium]|nr:hypothetical protein [Planctomycetota bacterium]